MKAAVVLAVLGLVGYASAECANGCSGHGTCQQDDECRCFPNWLAADCSERVCPFGLAWVDNSIGDLDHDGQVNAPTSSNKVRTLFSNTGLWEQFPYTAQTGEGHFYAECSNKGLCDRELGVCKCFDGYTGSACQRTTCPNDCSGHGICRTVKEIAEGGLNFRKASSVGGANFYTGVAPGAVRVYDLWDADKAQSCVCDPGYHGADCSLRHCPRGDDPLTFRSNSDNSAAHWNDCGGAVCATEKQVFTFAVTSGKSDWWYIEFDDWTGQTWRTDTFQLGSSAAPCATTNNKANTEARIKAALEAIPNGVFTGVTVDVTAGATAPVVAITFSATDPHALDSAYAAASTYTNVKSGNIAQLRWKHPASVQRIGSCESASEAAVDSSATVTFTSGSSNDGNNEEVVCSNRGVCDANTGLCKCFKGYYLGDCSRQNALAG